MILAMNTQKKYLPSKREAVSVNWGQFSLLKCFSIKSQNNQCKHLTEIIK